MLFLLKHVLLAAQENGDYEETSNKIKMIWRQCGIGLITFLPLYEGCSTRCSYRSIL